MFVCLCWGFTAQSTTRSCRAGELIVVLFLGRLRPSKRLTSTKRGRPRQYSNWQLPLGFNSGNYNISVMFSNLPKDRTLEMEDRWKKYIYIAHPSRTCCKHSRPLPYYMSFGVLEHILLAENSFNIHVSYPVLFLQEYDIIGAISISATQNLIQLYLYRYRSPEFFNSDWLHY